MAYNEKLTARVREALTGVERVEEKKMFRGVAFMVSGKLCITAGDDEIMLRIDPEIHDHLLQNYSCRTMIMKGKELKGYIVVKESVLVPDNLKYFIDLALAFNGKAKASPKKRKAE